VTLRRLGKGFASATLAVALTATLTAGVAGCSSHGANVSCSTTQCAVTFDRGISNASISVLGVTVKIVTVTNGSVTLSVAGNQVTIPVNQSVQVGGLAVTVKSVTASKVVVQISQGNGN
jgi:hypothetical protein